MALIDSNILVYAFNKEAGSKHKRAKSLFKKALRDEIQGAVSIQNLSEFYVVVTEKIANPMPRKEALENVEDIILSPIEILRFDENTVIEAVRLNKRHKVHYWDCLIAATMKENNIEKIYTENRKDFKKLPGLKPVSP